MAIGFQNLAYYFQTYGIMDFLLPFILVFTIIFAVLQKSQIFGTDPRENRKYNVVIALIMGLLFVVPHMTGSYPLGYDPVEIINQSLPSISLVAVAAIMMLMLMGIFGGEFSEMGMKVIALFAIGFVVYIFGSSLNLWTGPSNIFYWWTSETTELMLIVLVFGLIVWFITKEDNPAKKKDKEGNEIDDGAWKFMQDMFQKRE